MWLGILILAVVNGLLREAVLIPRIGHVGGQLASGLLLSLLVFAVTMASIRWIGLHGRGWSLGVLWLILTLVFEFGFGLARDMSLRELLQAYKFAGGNIWPVVLLVVLVSPPLAQAIRS